ncbi:hypothetical protein CW736_09840 [Nonlabens sp. MB-3u-79]|jgi:hypothetical protein|nr:hypothetical protein CW736_09840 [Nonlabens sp. MB-3u-79]
MRKKNKTYIRKPLLTLNDLLIIIGCTGFIIGLVFYVNYIITMDELNSSPKAQIIKNYTSIIPLSLQCQISDGKYKAIHDKEFSHYTNYQFEIKGDSICFESDNSSIKIDRFDSGVFVIHHPQINIDSLTEVQRYLVEDFKYSYYQIEECKGDTLKFRLGPNLHVTRTTGVLVRTN